MSEEVKAIINDLEEERERIRTKCLYPEDVINCENLIKIMDYIKQLQQRISKATKFIEMEVGIIPTLRGGYMARDELTKVGIGELYEILNGGENNK